MSQIAADLDTTPPVCVLTWFDDPQRSTVLRVLLQHIVISRIVVRLNKLEELTVGLAFFNMVRQR